MARLKSVSIHQLSGVVSGTTLTFSPLFNVILGREGSGHRDLLKLLGAILCADFSHLDGQVFDVECVMLTSQGELPIRIQRLSSEDEIEIRHGDTAHPLDAVPDQRPLSAEILSPEWSLLDGLTAPDGDPGAIREPRWIPDPILLQGLRSGPGPVEVDARYIPELSSVWYHLDYEKAWLTCDHVSQERIGRLGFRFRRSDDAMVGLDAYDAEKRRLLSMFYYVACRRDVALLDGMLNRIEEEAAGDLIKSLLHRQTFVTNTESRLLYQLSFPSAAAMRHACILCNRRDSGDVEWRAMSEAEAKKLYQFYDAGLKHIEDLARLW
ncbi:MAG: hypothetical protein AAFV53_11810 [Myxococcota bacterium]